MVCLSVGRSVCPERLDDRRNDAMRRNYFLNIDKFFDKSNSGGVLVNPF